MWEWLLEPVDPSRPHLVDFAVSWHGRIMVLAWGVLAPLAIIAARFLKVLPWQDWPSELDSQFWWRSHWIGQSIVVALTIFGVALVYSGITTKGWHGYLGYSVLIIAVSQAGLGMVRGSKGGPTARGPDGSLRGDHYDMTRWRLMFEAAHKSLGYLALALALLTVVFGLWSANAPRWMWLTIVVWWMLLLTISVVLQYRGWAVDTYQAIWGPDLHHPGNRRPSQGWGMRRFARKNATNTRKS